jgi:hypothetical protein
MTWSDEVHTSRLIQTLSQTRADRALRRKGSPIPVTENTNLLTSVFLLAATSCAFAAKRYADRLQDVQWVQLPVLKQFHDLIFGDSVTKLKGSKPKPKSSSKSKGRSKAAGSVHVAPQPSLQNLSTSGAGSNSAIQADPAAIRASPVQNIVVEAPAPNAPLPTRKPSSKGSRKSKKKK